MPRSRTLIWAKQGGQLPDNSAESSSQTRKSVSLPYNNMSGDHLHLCKPDLHGLHNGLDLWGAILVPDVLNHVTSDCSG
jgi:hypothetical protein